MVRGGTKSTLGSWAFLIGVVIAVIVGLLGQVTTWAWILVLLGLIVGLLNIAEKEVQSFLLAGTVLVVVSSLGAGVFTTITMLSAILDALMFMFVPATIIVALKSVFTLAKG